MAQYTTETFTYTSAFLDSILTAFSTRPAAALAAAPSIGLWTDGAVIPGPATTLADLSASEAAFSGYAEATPKLSGTVNISPDSQGVIGNATFIATGSPVTNPATAVGYYVFSGSVLVGAEMFPSNSRPNFATAGDFLDLDVQLPIANAQDGTGPG